MNTKVYFILLSIVFMTTSCKSRTQTYNIETNVGNIKIKLYENTPLHKANFEKLVEEQAYDGVLFHRVINEFMIQTGDLRTKPNNAGYVEGERIPAEFVSEYIHKKGALAAARMGDQVNPEKLSSPTQFYIVHGKTYTDEQLAQIEEHTGKYYTPEEKTIYKTVGGAPFLDKDYTVFGEVVEGLDVVDAIASSPTGARDFPVSEIRIIRITKN